jgi:hypothetical protein
MSTTAVCNQTRQQDGAQFLVDKARSGVMEELRQSRRFPFFQPVTVHLRDNNESLPAFSRDVSAWGIGLLLNRPLDREDVQLTIHFGEREEVSVSGTVRWCQACGHGWYLAGISFADGGEEIEYMIGGCTG